MILTTNNIKFVKELKHNGKTYEWFVSMKSNAISDARCYVNYDENRMTTNEVEYSKEKLPKVVQKFLESRKAEIFSECGNFTTYIYR